MYPKVRARGMSAYHPSIASSSSQPADNAARSATAPAAPPAAAPAAPLAKGAHQPGTPVDQRQVVDMSQPSSSKPLSSQSSSQPTSSKCKISAIIKESTLSAFPYYRTTSQSQLSLTSTSTHPSKRSQLSLPDSLHHSSQTNKTATAVMPSENPGILGAFRPNCSETYCRNTCNTVLGRIMHLFRFVQNKEDDRIVLHSIKSIHLLYSIPTPFPAPAPAAPAAAAPTTAHWLHFNLPPTLRPLRPFSTTNPSILTCTNVVGARWRLDCTLRNLVRACGERLTVRHDDNENAVMIA